jgi:hypothetical protein
MDEMHLSIAFFPLKHLSNTLYLLLILSPSSFTLRLSLGTIGQTCNRILLSLKLAYHIFGMYIWCVWVESNTL